MSKRELVRCFYGNLNGKEEGLIVAKSKKEAAKIAKCSLYSFNQYWSEGKFPPWNPEPYVLYTKKYGSTDKYEEKTNA